MYTKCNLRFYSLSFSLPDQTRQTTENLFGLGHALPVFFFLLYMYCRFFAFNLMFFSFYAMNLQNYTKSGQVYVGLG